MDSDTLKLMERARERVRRILDRLVADRADLEQNAGGLPAEEVAEGQALLTGAIESAQRTLERLEAALSRLENKHGSARGDRFRR